MIMQTVRVYDKIDLVRSEQPESGWKQISIICPTMKTIWATGRPSF